jgi:hypothetical protein
VSTLLFKTKGYPLYRASISRNQPRIYNAMVFSHASDESGGKFEASRIFLGPREYVVHDPRRWARGVVNDRKVDAAYCERVRKEGD